jgi:hypothetical protein
MQFLLAEWCKTRAARRREALSPGQERQYEQSRVGLTEGLSDVAHATPREELAMKDNTREIKGLHPRKNILPGRISRSASHLGLLDNRIEPSGITRDKLGTA